MARVNEPHAWIQLDIFDLDNTTRAASVKHIPPIESRAIFSRLSITSLLPSAGGVTEHKRDSAPT